MRILGSTMLLVLVMLMGLGPVSASADQDEAPSLLEGKARLREGQVVNGDYVAFGPLVEISGIVNGDLYAAGGDVRINGVVNGDVLVAGGRVVLSGTIAQDARVAGGHVTISGRIGRNATIGAGELELTDQALVHDNLLAGGGHVELAGRVGHDTRIGAWRLIVAGDIARDLVVAAESVRVTSKASVGGRLRYWSEAAPSIDEQANVHGPITRRPLPEGWSLERARQGLIGMRLLAAFVSFLSTLLLGLLLLRWFPQGAGQVTAAIRERPGASLGWGLAASIITPIAAASLVITLLLLPAGFLLFALYGVTLYLARIYAITRAGQFLLGRPADSSADAKPFVVGLVVYSLLALIPLVGGLVTALAATIGVGGLLLAGKERFTRAQEQDAVEGVHASRP